MEKLLQPDFGLIIWTAISFIILLIVLGRFAWKPILQGLEQREGKIRGDLERAEKSQKDAEALRLKYETDLAQAQRRIQEMINEARGESEKTREKTIQSAKDESEKIMAKGRRDLELEAERLREDLRRDVADLSLSITEKILARAVDKKMAEDVVKESLATMRGSR